MLSEGFGGIGAGRSSGAQQTFARAGQRLSENLAGQRANLQQNAISSILSTLGAGLSPTQQTIFRPGTHGLLGGLGSSFAQGIGSFGPLGIAKAMGLL